MNNTVYLVERFDAKLSQVTDRVVFVDETTAKKYVQEQLHIEQQTAELADPGMPILLNGTETTDDGMYFWLEAEGDELNGFYLTPARYHE